MADLRIADAPEIPTENITGEEKLPTGGSGNYSISLDSLADYTKTKKDLADNTSVNTKVNGVRQELETHIEDLLNPHQVTKGQIGLGNVDNTADLDKPVSNSTQSAIISAVTPKADKTYIDTQLALKSNKVEVYTKQESSDLVSSSISTALTPVNSSLELAKRGIINRYDPLLTYNSGERVVLTNGDIVKSIIDGNTNDPNVIMTGWVKTNSASQILDESGKSQQEINNSQLTVDSFGAKGDGVTDDSAAFQAYIDSASTGINVYLGHRKAKYLISKQVDFKNKGLVGHGFSRQEVDNYNNYSLYVDGAGDFSNADPALNNFAFINVGAEIRDLQVYCPVKTINAFQINGYNTTISNINISNFYKQIYIPRITVSLRVTDLMSIGAGHSGFHVEDILNAQSTTAYFDRCSWQWGEYSIIFDKEVFGCAFRNIVIEYMNGGISGKVFSNCTFDTIWAEQTRDGATRDWLVNTQNQQSFNNVYNNLYIRLPHWTNRADPLAIAANDAVGGAIIDDSTLASCNSTGGKTIITPYAIQTRHANYYGTSNNPLSGRKLSITTQDTAATTNFITPVVIEAPNGALWFKNRSDTDYTPVSKRVLIGANADNTAAHYGVDTYTKTMKKWTTKDYGSNTDGSFYAPMLLTYQSNVTDQQVNNGWTITKESTGQYLITRAAGNTGTLGRPHVLVSGVTVGAGVGGNTPTVHATQWVEAYSGSWQTYGVAAGFRVFFKDLAGIAIDVQRFTVAITSTV